MKHFYSQVTNVEPRSDKADNWPADKHPPRSRSNWIIKLTSWQDIKMYLEIFIYLDITDKVLTGPQLSYEVGVVWGSGGLQARTVSRVLEVLPGSVAGQAEDVVVDVDVTRRTAGICGPQHYGWTPDTGTSCLGQGKTCVRSEL